MVEFGALLSPDEVVADRAQLAEKLGYDLVAVPDGGDLDAWTLLGWVAGETSTIRLIGLLDLGERNPAVVARAAASLDLLSGGRLDLALAASPTAGISDQASPTAGIADQASPTAGIADQASPTAGIADQASPTGVEALAEAMSVVHGVLDAGEAGPLRHLGRHYRIPKAERGPLPAHRIAIGIAGDDPETLRLIGRTGDAWLATRGSSQLESGKIIDEAAVAAGREPAEIRRVLTVPPGIGADELLRFRNEHGFTTFLVTTDDPDELRRFAAEVAPAVRRALPDAPAGPFRPASVRAKRREGIDYDHVPASLAATAVEPGDLDYARVQSTYMRGGRPGLVLRPRTTAEVADGVRFAAAHSHLPFGVRSGGHGISGRSTNDGGLVLSLAAMNRIEVLDEARRLVRVQAGARWTDVAQALHPYGWALSSGDYGGVGVGGLATAGGVGWLAREHGLTIDHLRGAEIVLADGHVVRADDTENPDLFWAIRGAGGNFGVVTSFDFQVDAVGPVGFGQFVVGADDPGELLARWGAAIEASPRQVSGELIMGRPRPGQPAVAHLMVVADSDDPETIVEWLTPIASVGPLHQQNIVLTPYAGIMDNAAGGYHQGAGEPQSRSGLLEHLTPEFGRDAAVLLASGAVHWFQIRTVGGAVADVADDATAYAHRKANFSLVVMGSAAHRVDRAWAGLASHVDGMYLSFESGRGPELLTKAFPPATLARLRSLKARYDPANLFRDNFNITREGR